MAETAAGEMIVADLNDKFGLEGLPLRRPLCSPAAGSAGLRSGKTRGCDQVFEPGSKMRPVSRAQR